MGKRLACNKPLSRFLTHNTATANTTRILAWLLSSLNRSNSNALRHILPHFSPFCEGLHYSTTDLPWQIKSIFIILNISFHKPLNLDISGFLALFFNFVFCPYLTQIYVNLRKFMSKWCSKWCSKLVCFST